MLQGYIMKTLSDRVGGGRLGDRGWQHQSVEENHERDVKVHVDAVDAIDRT
jgi:hypothetical protein